MKHSYKFKGFKIDPFHILCIVIDYKLNHLLTLTGIKSQWMSGYTFCLSIHGTRWNKHHMPHLTMGEGGESGDCLNISSQPKY